MDMCVSWLCRYSLHMKKYLTYLIQHATQPFVEVMIILCLCNAMDAQPNPYRWSRKFSVFNLSKRHGISNFDAHWPLFRSQMLAIKDTFGSTLIELMQYFLEG